MRHTMQLQLMILRKWYQNGGRMGGGGPADELVWCKFDLGDNVMQEEVGWVDKRKGLLPKMMSFDCRLLSV